MIKTRKISCVAASVLVLLAGAVSCSKEGIGGGSAGESDGRITIVPTVDDVSPWGMKGTKGSTAPGGSSLHEDYSIYTSAYYTDTEFPTTDGNFFTGLKFDYDAVTSGWVPGTAIYWPADTGGNGIDFLAVATDTTAKGFGRKPGIVWAGQEGFLHGEKNVHGVRVWVPYSNDSTEVLYATAHRKCEKPADDSDLPVVMKFKHTQCCLEFHIHANLDSVIRLNNIYVKDAYSTGELTILTHPLESVTWNTDASEPHGVEVPGVRTTTGKGTPVTSDENLNYHVVMLPQERRDIVFSFRQISMDANPAITTPGARDTLWNGYSVEAVYTTTTEALKWEAGKKYIFDVTIKFGEIIIVPTVADWRDGEDFYQYVPV